MIFSNETDTKISKKIFEKSFLKFKKAIKKDGGQIGLIIVNDKKIREFNLKYRKKNKPTDVLSFPYGKGEGDIYISAETAEKQAKERGHSLNKELNILFIHGLLHLFGFDHGNDKEEEIMEGFARKIL